MGTAPTSPPPPPPRWAGTGGLWSPSPGRRVAPRAFRAALRPPHPTPRRCPSPLAPSRPFPGRYPAAAAAERARVGPHPPNLHPLFPFSAPPPPAPAQPSPSFLPLFLCLRTRGKTASRSAERCPIHPAHKSADSSCERSGSARRGEPGHPGQPGTGVPPHPGRSRGPPPRPHPVVPSFLQVTGQSSSLPQPSPGLGVPGTSRCNLGGGGGWGHAPGPP